MSAEVPFKYITKYTCLDKIDYVAVPCIKEELLEVLQKADISWQCHEKCSQLREINSYREHLANIQQATALNSLVKEIHNNLIIVGCVACIIA